MLSPSSTGYRSVVKNRPSNFGRGLIFYCLPIGKTSKKDAWKIRIWCFIEYWRCKIQDIPMSLGITGMAKTACLSICTTPRTTPDN